MVFQFVCLFSTRSLGRWWNLTFAYFSIGLKPATSREITLQKQSAIKEQSWSCSSFVVHRFSLEGPIKYQKVKRYCWSFRNPANQLSLVVYPCLSHYLCFGYSIYILSLVNAGCLPNIHSGILRSHLRLQHHVNVYNAAITSCDKGPLFMCWWVP